MSSKTTTTTSRRWLPREGFHADVLGSIIRQTLLNPTLVLPLVALARYTQRGQSLATQYPGGLRALDVLGIWGAVRVVNGWLSRRTINNRVTDKYDWSTNGKEVVVVTGGSDGIGKRIVQMLAERQIKVAVLDVQDLTYEAPATVRFYKCDITKTASITSAAAAIRAQLGEPTVLINNAGVCRGKPLLANTDADLELTFGVNTIAHYKLAREFLPYIVAKDHGMVVTVASAAAWVVAPRLTEYAASKAAAQAFHEGLSAELISVHKAPHVRTVLVNQGYTRTALFEGFGVRKDAFFGPPLHVDTVAESIVQQVLKGESAQLILPGFYRMLVVHFRSLPEWLQYPGRVDMDKLMLNWSGRQVQEVEGVPVAEASK